MKEKIGRREEEEEEDGGGIRIFRFVNLVFRLSAFEIWKEWKLEWFERGRWPFLLYLGARRN